MMTWFEDLFGALGGVGAGPAQQAIPNPFAQQQSRWQEAMRMQQAAYQSGIGGLGGMSQEELNRLWQRAHEELLRGAGIHRIPLPTFAPWRRVLGNCETLADAERAYRIKAKTAHPDNGGSNEAMAALNKAIAEARQEFRLRKAA